MFFCRQCGQCVYINDDSFYEYVNSYGWEKHQIDPRTGHYEECIDGETSGSDHESYECSFCNNQDIDPEWDGTREYAENIRRDYEIRTRESRERHKRITEKLLYDSKAKDPSRQWDVEKNI